MMNIDEKRIKQIMLLLKPFRDVMKMIQTGNSPPKTMIPATGNNWNFTGTGRKEAEKSLDPAGNVRKMMRNGSSISIGKFSDFFR